ncbi:tetratricopeptide repeat protein [Streptomyces sp. TLI_105]|uniref:tetratricopeptide repeat protein n=1 Tax=Streptomyces sp. TLI_105 TaxID=1881019 RepID=UPI0027343220|nr:tetratricopeptide repeat protein [Streptomyces sp. TLI_105]
MQIRVDRLKDGKRTRGFGSGYLVAPHLVLTAAHVLDDLDPAAGEPVTVSLPDTGEREYHAVVCWQRKDDTADAALIEVIDGQGWQVPQSLDDLFTRPPQRYGLIIGNRPLPVTATGFPRMQKDAEDGRRLDEQLTGLIAPGTGALAGRYEISSTDPTPGTGATGGSRWSGMSGATVLADDGFGGDLLCGVVRRDRRADGGTRLIATTAATLLADDAFRALVAQHTGWEPVLEPVEPAHLLTPATVDRNFRSPAALLRADTEAVAFYGRATELADLQAWCENGPPSISVRVMTGPGGQGKTRLARRLTDTLGRHGWVTGHLRSDLTDDPAPDGAPPDFTTLNTALPLLLVVDYAETRPRLLRRLVTHLHRSRHRVRLLLLARSDGEWRTGSLQAIPAVRDLLEEAPLTPLAPLIPTSQPTRVRHSAYHRAAGDLARLLPLVPTLSAHDWPSLAAELRPPADLHDHRYDNVLTLQMTALVDLLQHGPRPVDAAPGTPPERTLLKHEDRFWEASAKAPAHRLDLDASTLGAAVAVAALCGAATREEAVQVITTLPGLPGHRAAAAASWLAALYPADGDRYWGSLQPDRVAEYHASRVLEDDAIPLPALLAAGSSTQQAQSITVLARAAVAHSNTGRTTSGDRVLHTLGTALDTTPISYEAAESALIALPYPSLATAPLALQLSAGLTQINRELAAGDPTEYEPYLALHLSAFGIRLLQTGRRAEALDAEQEAVEILRRLTAADPAAYEPNLARSLSQLGNVLSEMGRRAKALDAEQEAVEIYRRLVAANPTAYEPDLAISLTNLGNRLSEMGRQAEALDTEQEAVEILHRLTAADLAAHEPNLATSLTNLGNRLSEMGRYVEALGPGEQAVEIYRRLAAANPSAYEPDLAGALSNLGARLLQVGRYVEALGPGEQAVEIYRRLAAAKPSAYEPDLAGALSNLGIELSNAGHHLEALAVAEQALEIRRRLAVGNPAAYEPALAASLANLGSLLLKVGHHSEAVNAAERAVEIYHRLAASNPAAHEPDFARTLSFLVSLHAIVHDFPEALRVTAEAVAFYQRRIVAMPTLLPGLHDVLELQALTLKGLGRLEEAETVLRWLGENPIPPDHHN